jgi:hypothetical protein
METTLEAKLNELRRKKPAADPEKSFLALFPKGEAEPLRIKNTWFFVIAMTRAQAGELDQETGVFTTKNSPNQTARLHQFKETLDRIFPHKAWLEHYGETPEDWVPFLRGTHGTISELLEREVMEYHVRSAAEAEMFPLSFWPDVKPKVKSSPYVLIIDGISLFHPMIRNTLQQEVSKEKDRAAVLVLSPVIHEQHPLEGAVETELDNTVKWAFTRFTTYCDALCEVNVSEHRRFQRWLFANIPELILRYYGVSSSTLLHDLAPKKIAELLTESPYPNKTFGEQRGIKLVGGARGGAG